MFAKPQWGWKAPIDWLGGRRLSAESRAENLQIVSFPRSWGGREGRAPRRRRRSAEEEGCECERWGLRMEKELGEKRGLRRKKERRRRRGKSREGERSKREKELGTKRLCRAEK